MKNVNLANSITCVRILGTFLMMFVDPFTSQFFTIYTVAGISDVLDGFVARITNTVSNFGARLDSTSDLFFYFVMAMKCMPAMIEILPYQIWYATAAVVLIRIITYMFVKILSHYVINHFLSLIFSSSSFGKQYKVSNPRERMPQPAQIVAIHKPPAHPN